MFSDADHLIIYMDTDGGELERIALAAEETVELPTKEPTYEPSESLSHWYVDQGAPEDPFIFGQTTDENLTLYPYITERSMAVFITNGVEIEPQLSKGPDFRARDPREDGAVMEREGYDFSHWSATENGETPFNFENTPIDGLVYIYAVWTGADVPYVVNIWAEKANLGEEPGDPSVAANQGNYDLVSSIEMTDKVKAGTDVTLTESDANTLYLAKASAAAKDVLNYCDFTWSETKTISGIGTTVVNVYYTRMVFTFNFTLTESHSAVNISGVGNNTKDTSSVGIYITKKNDTTERTGDGYSITAKLGDDISTKWPYEVIWPGGAYKFVNWSGYHGNKAEILSKGYIDACTSSGRGMSKTGERMNGKVATLKVTWTNLNFTETRYYYTELLAGETSEIKFTAKNYPSDKVERYYKLNQTAPTANQGSSPATGAVGWPGRAIEGFLTITAGLNGTTKITPNYQVIEAVNSNDYKIHYYMPRLSYTLTLIANGGSIDDDDKLNGFSGNTVYTKTLQYEAEIVLPDEDPTKANAIFDGWYWDEACTVPYVPGNTMPPRDTSLYAKYIGTQSKVKYYDSQTLIKTNQYAFDELIRHDLSGTDYADYTVNQAVPGKGIFLGWYYDVGDVLVAFPSEMRATKAEYELYAKWSPLNYTVTYIDEQNGGELGTRTVQSGANNIVAKSRGVSPAIDTLPGYTTIGWNTAEDGTGTTFLDSIRVTENITVYAKRVKTPHTVTYYLNDELYGAPSTQYYEDTVSLITGPSGDEWIGYNAFTGWTMKTTGVEINKENGTFVMPDGNVVLEGTMTPASFNVRYYLDEETDPTGQVESHAYLSTVSLRTNPTKPGFIFQGWTSVDDAVVVEDGRFDMPAKNIAFRGIFERASYTVTYYLNGAQDGPAQSIPYEESVTLRSAISQIGYTFSGWSVTTPTGVAVNGGTFAMPASNVEIHATLTQDSYTVTYLVDGQQSGTVESYHYNDSVTVRGVPTREGYTFSGWTSDHPSATGSVFAMPEANVTFTGTFTANGTNPPNPTTPDPTPTPPPDPGENMVTSPDPIPEREVQINGTTYTIRDEDVPLAGIGSRNMGDCPN